MNIQPLDDRVVLEIEEPEDETEGGIVLPDTAKEKPQRGEVVAAGPGKLLDSGERKSLSVEEGDTVIFGNYAGTDVEFDGKEYKIVKEDEIQAKLEV
jgi:chaperonin GroES